MYGKNFGGTRYQYGLADSFPIIMLTRNRYKCAGWHIMETWEGNYALTLPGEQIPRTEEPTLERAVNYIVDEFYRLTAEVESMEKEREKNAKVRLRSF